MAIMILLILTIVMNTLNDLSPPPPCSENTYDTVGPTVPVTEGDHVAMETNPAYGVCTSKL